MSGTDKYYINKTDLKDGIIIYQSPDAKVNNWYVRILLEKGGYIRRSLKTTVKERAIRKAVTMANDVRRREMFGLSVTERTFETVAKEFIEQVSSSMSEHRKVQHVTMLTRYLIPYFNKMKISDFHKERDYIEKFVLWRREFWRRYEHIVEGGNKQDNRFKAQNVNIKPDWKATVFGQHSNNRSYDPATTTVRQTISTFNQIMVYSYKKKYTAHLTKMSYDNVPVRKPTSQSIYTFEDEDINKIKNYMRQEYRKNKKWVLDDDGNRVKDEDGNDMYTLWETQRRDTKHMFINMRGWFYMLIWSGARVREANYAKWGDLAMRSKVMPDGTKLDYIAWTIPEYKAKRIAAGHFQRVVFLPHHLTKILNEVRKQNKNFNRDDNYIFTMEYDDKPLLNISKYSFRKILKKLDLYKHKSGAYRTSKHLRSWYASKLLQTQPLHKVAALLGNSPEVLFQMYSQLEIAKKAYDILKDVPQPDEVINLVAGNEEEELE